MTRALLPGFLEPDSDRPIVVDPQLDTGVVRPDPGGSEAPVYLSRETSGALGLLALVGLADPLLPLPPQVALTRVENPGVGDELGSTAEITGPERVPGGMIGFTGERCQPSGSRGCWQDLPTLRGPGADESPPRFGPDGMPVPGRIPDACDCFKITGAADL